MKMIKNKMQENDNLYQRRRKMRKALPILLLGLSFVLMFTACTPTPTQTNESTQQIEVTHAMGKTKVPANPKRVVVLTNEGLEAILSLGIKPVGTVRAFTGGGTWYKHLEKELQSVTNVGTESQPNIEEIAKLKPDVIIGNKMTQEKVYQQLSAIAPTVFAEELRGDWKSNLQLYAKAVNKEEKGKQVLANFDKRVAELKTKLGNKINTKISLVRFMPGETRLYLNDTFAGTIFKQIGLKRPTAQDKDEFKQELTKERIADADGDVIFYFTYEEGDGKATQVEKTWLIDPLWKNLNAVKKNKVYNVDDVIWNTAGGVKAANLMLDELETLLMKN
jgi:iron complex transport system substrate-binding protein